MKLSLTLALVGALASTALAKTNEQKCQSKNKNVPLAIEAFCAPTNLVVPSTYATNGKHAGQFGPKDTVVTITGSCSPAQWVPQKYCLSQFYEMCAYSNKKGAQTNAYGRNGCQSWKIDVGPRATY
ncbi:hypothetical protein LTR08_003311 [Meristemomyces frigidus]|nr:hypothetical protein LTR08_003311 [Meristemomyces frigidus]